MSNLLTIPRARSELLRLADEIEDAAARTGQLWAYSHAQELRDLVDRGLYRRVGPRTAVRSRTITPEVRKLIRATKDANPDWSHQKIGDYVGVNTGRVSETLRGFR